MSSSLEKSKEKQLNSTKKLLENASEFYVTNNKEAIFQRIENDASITKCYIKIDYLVNEQYVDKDAVNGPDGEKLEGNVVFNISSYTFQYQDNVDGINEC